MITYSTTLTGTTVLDLFNGASPTGTWQVQIQCSKAASLSVDGTTVGATLFTTSGSSNTSMPPYTYIVKDQPLYLINQGSTNAVNVVIVPVIPVSLCVGVC